MIRNYLVVALRTLWRGKVHSLINVFGLALGIATCLLIYVYVRYDLSWDHHNENLGRLYRVINRTDEPGKDPRYARNITALFAETCKGNIPGIEEYVRYTNSEDVIRIGAHVYEEEIGYAEPGIFNSFTFPVIRGQQESPLEDLSSVVITEELAKKYFKGSNPIGQTIEVKVDTAFIPLVVTAVVQNAPPTATINPKLFVQYEHTYEVMRRMISSNWTTVFSETYVMLEEGVSREAVEQSLATYIPSVVDREEEEDVWKLNFVLQPLAERHMSLSPGNVYPTEVKPTGLYVLSGIGIAILLIACINFTTLAIGRSTSRSREIGVRKVLGAMRIQLVRQFFVEIFLLTIIAMSLGIVLAELLLPLFNTMFERVMTIQYDVITISLFLLLAAAITLVAGGYPALVISGFPPVAAFRGAIRVGGKRRLRQSLVFLQFGLSIMLITITLVMSRQLAYVQNKQLGFHGEQVVEIAAHSTSDDALVAMERLRQELRGDPGILSISGTQNGFGHRWTSHGWTNNGEEFSGIYSNTVDHVYLQTMQIPVVEGRDFDPEIASDEQRSFIVNKAFLDYFGWDYAVGRSLPGNFKDNEIIGVVDNFHFSSLYDEVQPLMIGINPWLFFSQNDNSVSSSVWFTMQNVLIRVDDQDIAGTMKRVEKAWQEVVPDMPFDYRFIDENVDRQYREDQRWSQLISYASILAVLIGALGVFGLAMLEVSQRTREIGIRKVLGASVPRVVLLLSKEITFLVLLANALAWPVAWLLMNRWMDQFAYKAGISPLSMVLAGMVALLIAWMTIGGLAWNAANSNPVDALRAE